MSHRYGARSYTRACLLRRQMALPARRAAFSIANLETRLGSFTSRILRKCTSVRSISSYPRSVLAVSEVAICLGFEIRACGRRRLFAREN